MSAVTPMHASRIILYSCILIAQSIYLNCKLHAVLQQHQADVSNVAESRAQARVELCKRLTRNAKPLSDLKLEADCDLSCPICLDNFEGPRSMNVV
jgi:hypothetical protein